MLIEGDELYINGDVDRELRVEVVDATWELVDTGPKGSWTGHYLVGREKILSGFSREDCHLVAGDSLQHKVRWEGGSLGRWKGNAVRLRFIYRRGTVYSFQIR